MTNGLATSLNLNAMETDCLDFAELSDMYRYFRINSLRVKSWVFSNLDGTAEAQAFGIYFEPNSSAAQLELRDLEGKFALGIMEGTARQGTPAELALAREELHTITPWFVTLDDTAAGADTDGPGNITLAVLGTTPTVDGRWLVDIHMSITFRSRLDPSTIQAALRRRVEDELMGSKVEKSNSTVKPEMQQAPRTKVPGVVRRQ